MTNIITMPFAWIMRLFYSLTGSYGWTLILFTLVVKLVFLPFQLKSKKSMVRMGRLSNKQAELQKKYANNQQKYQEELQKLYAEAGVNPMGGCLWSFLPLAILIPLYSIVRMPLQYFMRLGTDTIDAIRELAQSVGYVPAMSGETALSAYEQIGLAEFVNSHWDTFAGKFDGLLAMDFNFLGVDLSVMPSSVLSDFHFSLDTFGLLLIPILSGFLSWLLSHISMSSNGQSASQPGMMKSMNIVMPLMSVYIGFIMPASLGIYWVGNSVFSIIQESTLGKYYNKKIQAEEDEREAAREADRKRRMEEAKQQAALQRENQKKNPPPKKQPEKKISTNTEGRIGGRPYARGRSYVENRYENEE